MKRQRVLRQQARHPAGFTLIEIMIVVMIIGLLAAIAMPSINASMARTRYNAIVNNLRVIDNQKQLWAAALKKGDHEQPAESDLAPFFANGRFPTSVMGETYHINSVGTPPTATVPSRLKMPEQTIESGGTITLPDQ